MSHMSHRPVDELSPSPAQATHSDVTAWSQGIFTRAALIDTPLWRRAPYVTASTPVTGDELADVVEADRLRPGAGKRSSSSAAGMNGKVTTACGDQERNVRDSTTPAWRFSPIIEHRRSCET